MGMTMTQKILARAAGVTSCRPGELLMCRLDMVLGNDITAPVAINEFVKMGATKVFDPAQIALMCDKEEGDIRRMIADYEAEGIILGYKTLIDWDKTDREFVNALIEVKVVPQKDKGFDYIAKKIYNYPEVQSLYLMSGGFDFAIMLEGKTMKEVAFFVAQKLATIDGISATATHFVLKKYKDKGVIYKSDESDPRNDLML